MATIAVTGSGGLLGATLMRTLPNAVALVSDVRDRDALIGEAKKSGASWIVHTAALTDVGRCEREPELAHAVNTAGTAHVIEAARAIGARVLFISTVSVFKGDTGNYRESDVPEAINVYNTTKRAAEELVLGYEKGMVLRLNIIGIHPDGSRGRNFLEWLTDSLRAHKDMTLFSDARINPLSNWTIAEFIRRLIESGVEERILHIGSADVQSKAEIGRMLLAWFPEYAGSIREGSLSAIADGVWRPREMWLNTDRAARTLGPMPDLRAELTLILENNIDKTQK